MEKTAERIKFDGEVAGKFATAKGDQIHAMMADRGRNACVEMLRLAAEFSQDSFANALYEMVASPDGSGLGIAMRDEPSGALTVCLGKMRADKKIEFSLD